MNRSKMNVVSNVVVSNECGLKLMVSNELVSIVMEPLWTSADLMLISCRIWEINEDCEVSLQIPFLAAMCCWETWDDSVWRNSIILQKNIVLGMGNHQ